MGILSVGGVFRAGPTLARLPFAAVRGARQQVRATLEDALGDPEFADAWAACWRVPGWLDRDAARLLFALARDGPGEGAIVELGSYLGRSTVVLALGARAGEREKVVTVDPHEGVVVAGTEEAPASGTWDLFRHHLEITGVAGDVEALRARSEDAGRRWVGPIRLLYVDTLHHFDAVLQDIEVWAPHLVPGGVAVFDDYDVRDVQQAIAVGQERGLLPSGVLRVGEAAVCGIPSARALRRLLFPRAR